MTQTVLKNLTRGDNSLTEFEGFMGVGQIRTITTEPDWRPCNVRVHQKYIRAIQAIRPTEATAYAEGRYRVTGHFRNDMRYHVPIQFYREKLMSEVTK